MSILQIHGNRKSMNSDGGKPISPDHNLTAREIEILKWIQEGKSSWEISMILNCSKRVIDFHANNIKRKLNACTRAQAVAIGLRRNIIPKDG